MELVVRKNDLLRELQLFQGIVERKNTIPILANVLMEAKGDLISFLAAIFCRPVGPDLDNEPADPARKPRREDRHEPPCRSVRLHHQPCVPERRSNILRADPRMRIGPRLALVAL